MFAETSEKYERTYFYFMTLLLPVHLSLFVLVLQNSVRRSDTAALCLCKVRTARYVLTLSASCTKAHAENW